MTVNEEVRFYDYWRRDQVLWLLTKGSGVMTIEEEVKCYDNWQIYEVWREKMSLHIKMKKVENITKITFSYGGIKTYAGVILKFWLNDLNICHTYLDK